MTKTATASLSAAANAVAVLELIEKFEGQGIHLFGKDYTPSSITHPELSDPSTVIDQVFSFEELSVIAKAILIDENAGSNVLGAAILEGRFVPTAILAQLLSESIPYGFSVYISDPQEFFKDVGKIAIDQQNARIKAALNGDFPLPTFADPAEIAFTRHTNFNPDEAGDILKGNNPPPEPLPLSDNVQQHLDLLKNVAIDMLGADNFQIHHKDGKLTVVVEPGAVPVDVFSTFCSVVEFLIPNALSIKSGTINSKGQVTYDDAAPIDVDTVVSNFEEMLGAVDGVTYKKLTQEEFLTTLGLLPDVGPSTPLIIGEAKDLVNETLDETYDELKAVSDAGLNDSRVLAKQIEKSTAQYDQIVNLLAEDADNLIKSAQNVKAGLALLTQNSAEINRLKGNARMIADAFDALSTDLDTLQRIRAS